MNAYQHTIHQIDKSINPAGVEPPVTEVNSWASWALGEYLYRPTRRS